MDVFWVGFMSLSLLVVEAEILELFCVLCLLLPFFLSALSPLLLGIVDAVHDKAVTCALRTESSVSVLYLDKYTSLNGRRTTSFNFSLFSTKRCEAVHNMFPPARVLPSVSA